MGVQDIRVSGVSENIPYIYSLLTHVGGALLNHHTWSMAWFGLAWLGLGPAWARLGPSLGPAWTTFFDDLLFAVLDFPGLPDRADRSV